MKKRYFVRKKEEEHRIKHRENDMKEEKEEKVRLE